MYTGKIHFKKFFKLIKQYFYFILLLFYFTFILFYFYSILLLFYYNMWENAMEEYLMETLSLIT
ncbi:MAG: hypothetical protein E7Z73_09960 [Methanobrevibacter millerae]|uniref:Uncharacterized protein n=1 Tax=Methanobrevibacter millerae TaxID=230361 RepID=A0A8T3VD52_9EURY|nr:hypothetical protein [Methanobrevibacter millerae]